MSASRSMFGGVTRDDRYQVEILEPFADSLWTTELVQQGKLIPIKKGDGLVILDTSSTSPLVLVEIKKGEYLGDSCFVPRKYLEVDSNN
ncbi:hypothetical protein D3C87_1964370 [compost metagenome]